MNKERFNERIFGWWERRDPLLWLVGSSVAIAMLMVGGLLLLIMVRGMSYFWPSDLIVFDYREYSDEAALSIAGMEVESEQVLAQQLIASGYELERQTGKVERILVKVGNRDIGPSDFLWVLRQSMENVQNPEDIVVVQRREWGDFYGYLEAIEDAGQPLNLQGEALWQELDARRQQRLDLHDEINRIEEGLIGDIGHQLEYLRLQEKRLTRLEQMNAQAQQELTDERQRLNDEFAVLRERLAELYQEAGRDTAIFKTADGSLHQISIEQIVYMWRPNQISVLQKLGVYFVRLGEFLLADPREANTEGGVFPAIFGTVIMVLLMTILVMPIGVITAIYLKEYARQGVIIRTVRIAINNLAGVPSIVYGIFGLGFFVYFVGGEIDEIFFLDALPAPTFGSPGLLWASLTLALLSLPVVVVATEEGLSRVPQNIREGSMALGATKFETLAKVLLPMISPAIITGLILAIGRAAGEVAPLMLVGAVKLAPSLPLDATFPYLHLDRQFMHLGFHIYDVGFQSPNVEAARPLVYATAFLLVLIIVALNLSAIRIRNNLRERYRNLES